MTPTDTITADARPELVMEPEPADLVPRDEPSRPRVVDLDDGRDAAHALENVRVIVRMTKEIDQLFAALAEAQAMDGYGDVEKSKTARVQSKKGDASSYTYDYETLQDVIDATRPYLAKVGIATIQFPFPGNRSVTIRTMLAHKSGQWLYNDLSAVIVMPDPQAVGSGISYLRRYALKAITNVAAKDEDDDGARASQARPTQREQPRPAARKSEQAPPERISLPTVGTIKEFVPSGSAAKAMLSTGYAFAIKLPELVTAAQKYFKSGERIEVTCKPSSDPSKFLPVLEEIVVQRG